MNKTAALFGVVAGLAGAGITYGLKSKDTTLIESAVGISKEGSGIFNAQSRISTEFSNKYDRTIRKCREYVKKFKTEIGSPGVVVGVSIDGNIVWEEGFGFANLETNTPCLPDTAMRIASISKPMAMTLLAKLLETQNVSFDDSVHQYVSYFPKKKVDGEEVDITIRQLASHTSGVRHYKKKGEESDDPRGEFYIKDKFENIEKSVGIFKDDELFFKPGTAKLYTTHGYTLISAVIENLGKKSFAEQIENFFRTLHLNNTHLDKVQKIIYGRASYYDKDKHGRVINAQLADVSYKWAGGGVISTVKDLLKFGNAMLYCFQQGKNSKPGYLTKKTIQEMWTPVKETIETTPRHKGYGLGWEINPKLDELGGLIEVHKFYVGHTGGAVGASSILSIYPKEVPVSNDENNNETVNAKLPQGLGIAILVNLQNVSCRQLSKNIAQEFFKVYDC